MLYDLIQGQLREGLKVGTQPILMSGPFASVHAIKRLMVNYDTQKQYLNFFFGQIFQIIPHSASCDLQNHGVTRSSSSPLRDLFVFIALSS